MLCFPLVFSMADAAKPIGAFNFGAGKIERTKKAIFITMIYTTVVGLADLCWWYWISVFTQYLFDWLGMAKDGNVAPSFYDDTKHSLWVMMIMFPIVSLLIGAQAWFGSTDKIFGNLMGNLMWTLMTIPMLFIWEAIAKGSDLNYIFWGMYPSIALAAGIVMFSWALISMKLHKDTNLVMEDKIEIAQKAIRHPFKTMDYVKEQRELRTSQLLVENE